MSKQAKDHGVDEEAPPEVTGKLVHAVLHFTVQLLGQGTAPAQLSFALGFVSTETGLHVTSSAHALGVFQTVRQAVTTAGLNAPSESQDTAEDRTTESAPAARKLGSPSGHRIPCAPPVAHLAACGQRAFICTKLPRLP